jgi:hypothetical protein
VACQHVADDKTPPDSGYTTPSQHTLSDQEFEEEWNVDERSLEYEATFLGRQKRALSPHKNGADSPTKPALKKTSKQSNLSNYFPASSTS